MVSPKVIAVLEVTYLQGEALVPGGVGGVGEPRVPGAHGQVGDVEIAVGGGERVLVEEHLLAGSLPLGHRGRGGRVASARSRPGGGSG